MSASPLSPSVARSMWAAAEPFALVGLASPEAMAAIEVIGVPRKAAFLALRGAPMGRASASVVAAAFHAFPRSRFEQHLDPVWEVTTPLAVVEATHTSIPVMAARIFGDSVDGGALRSVGDLLVATVAALDVAGRPLAAANQAVVPPAEPWARLWRAWTTLREYRGDGHVAALVASDLDVPEAQVLSATWGSDRYDIDMLRATRRLDDDVWSSAQAALHVRGLLDRAGALTASGRALREDIELRTDQACMRAWSRFTTDELRTIFDFTSALSAQVIESGGMRAATAVGAPWPPPALELVGHTR
ncbi:MAG: hypothetical protein PHU75_11405 [Candidatus Nanopelagicales bacterium]|nr:hypothetical protein [Candidatus Nanopelagicales bacterium]